MFNFLEKVLNFFEIFLKISPIIIMPIIFSEYVVSLGFYYNTIEFWALMTLFLGHGMLVSLTK